MDETLNWLKKWHERESHFCKVGGTEGEYPQLVANLGKLIADFEQWKRRAEAAEAAVAAIRKRCEYIITEQTKWLHHPALLATDCNRGKLLAAKDLLEHADKAREAAEREAGGLNKHQ
jgi:hypothetical protein